MRETSQQKIGYKEKPQSEEILQYVYKSKKVKKVEPLNDTNNRKKELQIK